MKVLTIIGEGERRKWNEERRPLKEQAKERERGRERKKERETYEPAYINEMSRNNEVGTPLTVYQGRHCGRILEDGGSRARTAIAHGAYTSG